MDSKISSMFNTFSIQKNEVIEMSTKLSLSEVKTETLSYVNLLPQYSDLSFRFENFSNIFSKKKSDVTNANMHSRAFLKAELILGKIDATNVCFDQLDTYHKQLRSDLRNWWQFITDNDANIPFTDATLLQSIMTAYSKLVSLIIDILALGINQARSIIN